jgi:23S rRNA (guanosine2251-2'-O)-methyltransferase
MQTRCPYKQCQQVFDIADGTAEKAPRTATCPQCGRLLTVKPLEIWLHIDKQEKRNETAVSLASLCAAGKVIPFSHADKPGPTIIALLDDVRSLWNVGSIFRSADGAGVNLLILCGITGTPPRKEIAKTSLGAEDSVPWLYCASPTDVCAQLKGLGYTLIGLEVTSGIPGVPDSRDLNDVLTLTPQAKSVCLLVGNEVTGLSMEALQSCDLICSLPMRGVKESLNVAVAFGIASYKIAEQLLQSS